VKKRRFKYSRCSKWYPLTHIYKTTFSIDQQLVDDVLLIRLLMTCQWGAASSRWCHEWLSCTHVPVLIPKFGSQLGLGVISLQFRQASTFTTSSLLLPLGVNIWCHQLTESMILSRSQERPHRHRRWLSSHRSGFANPATKFQRSVSSQAWSH